MNILDAFGGVQRILLMLLGSIVLFIGVTMMVASSRGVANIVGAATDAIPGAATVKDLIK